MSAFRFDFLGVDDANEQQQVRGNGHSGEELTKVHRVQSHGLYSNPPEGSHGVGLPLGEERELTVVLGGESAQHRPRNMPRGTTALYNAFSIMWKLLAGKADLDHGGKDHHARNVGKHKIEATNWSQVDSPAVYLGKPPYYPVMTTAGPSQHVFAGIGPAAPDTPSGTI